VAVVALGGYGRGEQCLHSDVDVMLLHEVADPDRLARHVLYPLWDANLKVGHSVRTVAEAVDAARSRLDTLTSLLSARLVAGDAALLAALEKRLAAQVRGRPLSPALAAEERVRRSVDTYQVMAADLKNGRGALRTFQGLWWERRRTSLLGAEPEPETAEEREARGTLLAVRNALHAAAGRAIDEYNPDLREPAARWLGEDVAVVSARLCEALRTGDRLAERRWPDLHPGDDPMVGFGRRVFARIRSRFRPVEVAPSRRPLDLAVRAAARPEGVWFTSIELEQIRAGVDERWTAGDRDSFLSLISAGERGRAAFDWLEELGWVGAAIPEWEAVAAAPQLAPFHEHPVDAHLWRCVDEMQALVEGADPLVGRVVAELGSTEELLLSAFFHDIGKAQGGDHAEVGAVAVERFCRRAGFGPATSGAVIGAVRHHLMLARAATRRDIADPAVVAEVVDAAGNLRSLQILYLLTIADSRATGRTMWSEWKATLLRQLFVRAAAQFGDEPADPAGGALEAVLAAAGDAVPPRAVEEHVAAMPGGYLDIFSPEHVLWHMEAAAGQEGDASILVRPGSPTDTAVVVGNDRAGFLLATSSVFAANGIGILSARLMTRADGTVIDTFQVHRDRGREAIPGERWHRVEHDLRAALAGRIDVAEMVRKRAEAYTGKGKASVQVAHRPGAAPRHTVIEVRATDRIGLLADIVGALYAEHLDIDLAVVETRGTDIVDVFHVRRDGHPIRDEAEVAAICRRVADRIAR
jgi:[protein-PII] uridylyltransferase